MGLPKALMHSMTERGIAHNASASSNSNGSLPAAPSPSSANGGGAGVGGAQTNAVKLKIVIEPGWWLAGETVKGTLEVAVSSTNLALGEVGVEFSGFEELRSRDHTSTRRLLSSRIDFQGGSLPPSNAVVPGSKPLNKHQGYYPALKGKTKFNFSFKTPKSAPSSCALGTNATTRYEIRAFASSVLGGNVDVRSTKIAVPVVERWADWEQGEWWEGAERQAAAALRLGGEGKFAMTCQIGKEAWAQKPSRLFWRNDTELNTPGNGKITIHAMVKNGTKKNLSGLKVSLCRRLRIIYPEGYEPSIPAPIVTSTIFSQNFHGEEFLFPSGQERETAMTIDLPKEEGITVRKGKLFEIDVLMRVEADDGLLADDLAVELPIFIAHPHSLPPSAHASVRKQSAGVSGGALAPLPPPSPAGFLDPRQQSPNQQHLHQQHHLQRSGSYNDFGQAPSMMSPSGSVVGFGTYSPSPSPMPGSMSSYAMHQQQQPLPQEYQQTPPRMTPSPSQHFFPPPPPLPEDLYVAVNPHTPDLTASRVFDHLTHQFAPPMPTSEPQPIYHHPLPPPPPPPSVQQQTYYAPLFDQSGMPPREISPIQYTAPPRPLSAHSLPPTPVQHYAPPPHPPPTYVPPTEIHYAAPTSAAMVPPPIPPPRRSPGPYELVHALSPRESPIERPRSAIGPRLQYPELLTREHEDQVAASNAPIPPFSIVERAGASSHCLNYSTPPATWDQYVPSSVPEPSKSPVPSIHRSPSAAVRMTSPPLPPPAPSARYSSPQQMTPSVHGMVYETETDAGLLETIGEDGESQAGTARSVNPELVNALRNERDADDERVRSVQSQVAAMPSRSSAQDLEDLVDEEDRKNAAAAETQEQEQSKPKTPVTMLPRAQDIFTAPSSTKVEEVEAPTPSKSPSRHLNFPPRAEGGLSALEKRLSRPSTPEVGSNSVADTTDRIRSMSISAEHDDTVEAVRRARAGIAYPSPKVRREPTIPVASAVTLEYAAASEPVKELEDRPVVSAARAPAPARASEPTPAPKSELLAEPVDAAESTPASPLLAAPPSPDTPRRRPTFKSRNRGTIAWAEPATATSAAPSPPTPSAEPVCPPQLVSPVQDGRKIVDAVEVKVLKKEAVTRVSDWLQDSPTSSPMSEASPFHALTVLNASGNSDSTSTTRSPAQINVSSSTKPGGVSPWSLRASTRPGHKSTRSEPMAVRPPSPLKRTDSVTVLKALEPTMEELIAKTHRSARQAGLVSRSPSKFDIPFEMRRSPTKLTFENDLRRSPSMLSASRSSDDIAVKYDHNSSRGGRSGLMSNAAGKWTTNTDSVEDESEMDYLKPFPKLGSKISLLTTSVSQPLAPVGNRALPGKVSPSASAAPSPRRLHYPSTAKPFINTTVGRGAIFSTGVRSESRSQLRTSASLPSVSSELAARRARYEAAAAALT